MEHELEVISIPTGVSINAKESKSFNLKFVGCDRNSDLNTTQSMCLNEEASRSPSNVWLIDVFYSHIRYYEHIKTQFADLSLHQRFIRNKRLTECYKDVRMKLRG